SDGYQQLFELGAIEAENRGQSTVSRTHDRPEAQRGAAKPYSDPGFGWRLTDTGRTLARIPIDVKLARMLLESERLHALREVSVIAAFLSIQDPRERPAEVR